MVSGMSGSAGSVIFLGRYALISRGFVADGFDTGVGTSGGGGSTIDRMEFRLFELRKLGGDFMEKPERVLSWLMLLTLEYPPPGPPLCGAVRGLSMISSGNRGMVGAAPLVLIVDCGLEASLFDRNR
jgi:hypothetical protein